MNISRSAQEKKKHLTRSIILNPSMVSEFNNESLYELDLTIDQDFIENKRIKSLKLFNTCEFSRFIKKIFPDFFSNFYEFSFNLSKKIIRQHKI